MLFNRTPLLLAGALLLSHTVACGTSSTSANTTPVGQTSDDGSNGSNDPNNPGNPGRNCTSASRLLASGPNDTVCATKPGVQLQITGNLGADATVAITGPGNYSFTAKATPSGNSCQNKVNWQLGNATVGVYTVDVTPAQGSPSRFTLTLVNSGDACDDAPDINEDR